MTTAAPTGTLMAKIDGQPSIRKPAKVIVYALTTHCSPVVEKPRLVRIDGSATFTTATSRITMNWARQTTKMRKLVEAGRGDLMAVVAFTGISVRSFVSR